MEIKVPQRIRIGGHYYEILLSDDIADRGKSGECNHKKQTLLINTSRPESQKIESLIHEIIHAIDSIYGSDDMPEATVSGLSEGLYQVFQQLGLSLNWKELDNAS